MNPFDQAWIVLKAPMIPDSLRRVTSEPSGEHDTWAADFQDPVTNEVLPTDIVVRRRQNDGTYFGIPMKKPSPRLKIAGNISDRNHMNARTLGDRNTTSVMNARTEQPYRQRGYAKNLYDTMAEVLSNYDQTLTPDNDQSPEAQSMWQKYAPEGIWPVR